MAVGCANGDAPFLHRPLSPNCMCFPGHSPDSPDLSDGRVRFWTAPAKGNHSDKPPVSHTCQYSASLPPLLQGRNEISGAGQFHIDGQVFFQSGNRVKYSRRLRIKLEVHLNGRFPPAQQERAASPRDEASARTPDAGSQTLQKLKDLCPRDFSILLQVWRRRPTASCSRPTRPLD